MSFNFIRESRQVSQYFWQYSVFLRIHKKKVAQFKAAVSGKNEKFRHVQQLQESMENVRIY